MGIEKLNPMQKEAFEVIKEEKEVILLSPTGSGKTLAFLLPIIAQLDSESTELQALILSPSRELALQIETVLREMGTGYKSNAVYGGRAMGKDKIDIKHTPSILVGTPGRVADHLRRNSFDTRSLKFLVLDEFDKSLEIGFETDMHEILDACPWVEKKILTSATQRMRVPQFVGLKGPKKLNYLMDENSALEMKLVLSEDKDKLERLVELLSHIGNHPGIVFCNFRESIERVSDYLTERGIEHGTFSGGMEQQDREQSLIKFRNSSQQLLIATDLAARGIDIPELNFIIHYHLPVKEHEFTHRNGRTARMNATGTAYILKWKGEDLPEFIGNLEEIEVSKKALPKPSEWRTVYITAGRRDKISKGDIAGFMIKQGKLEKDDLGLIEIKPEGTYVAVKADKVKSLIAATNNTRIKKTKVRVRLD